MLGVENDEEKANEENFGENELKRYVWELISQRWKILITGQAVQTGPTLLPPTLTSLSPSRRSDRNGPRFEHAQKGIF